MSVPGIVQSQLDGEQVAAQVPLGGEDALFVTPSRTLIYRADGLLSDESVEEYPHEAERIEISEGRRKSAIALDYGIEGDAKFKVPSNRLYEALHPVLAGVLNAAEVTGPEETVKQTYQFSELTLVITSERVVKHVGSAVWNEDYEEYHFADVTRLDVEEGSVSSQIIVEADGRPQRVKTPSDQTREVRERIERALLEYHDVSSYDAFASERADSEGDDEDETDDGTDTTERADPLAGGVDPIEANPPELDDEGTIVEDDASVTTGERDDGGVDSEAGAAADAGTAEPAEGREDQSDAQSGPASQAEPAIEQESAERASAAAPEATDGAEIIDADAADGARTNDATGGDEPVATGSDEPAAATGQSETAEEAESAGGFADSGFESASSDLAADDTDAQLEALTEAVERQNELLAEQQRTLERLIDELSRGR